MNSCRQFIRFFRFYVFFGTHFKIIVNCTLKIFTKVFHIVALERYMTVYAEMRPKLLAISAAMIDRLQKNIL